MNKRLLNQQKMEYLAAQSMLHYSIVALENSGADSSTMGEYKNAIGLASRIAREYYAERTASK